MAKQDNDGWGDLDEVIALLKGQPTVSSEYAVRMAFALQALFRERDRQDETEATLRRRVEELEGAARLVLGAAEGWGQVTEREEDFVVESYDIPAALLNGLRAALAATTAPDAGASVGET